MRGRNNNRGKGPNPLTRSYESNGPDVKIRGTAQHIADKYAQLARDAQSSGDPVAAENYFQHAEHYYRMIAAAQEQFRQQYGTFQRSDEDSDEGDEEGGQANGFGYGERQSAGQMDEMGDGYPQPYMNGGDRGPQPRYDRQDRGDRQQHDRGDRQPDRGDRQDRGQRFDRNDRGDRYDRQSGPDRQGGPDRQNGSDRQGGFDPRQDRNGADRGERSERQAGGPERQDRGDRPERDNRPDRGDRPDRGERRERYPRGGGDSREQPRRDFARPERPARAEQPRGGDEDAIAANLPAFLTNPVRTPIAVSEPDPVSVPADEVGALPEGEIDGVRPRTRRPRTRRAAEPAGDVAEVEKTNE
jgi:hypothetical protein